MKRTVLSALALGCLLLVNGAALAKAGTNDFPTDARAEYVFACMATNAQTREFLRKCSCAVDAVAARLSYDEYVHVETILRLQAANNARIDEVYRSVGIVKAPLEKFYRAQAAAQIRCF